MVDNDDSCVNISKEMIEYTFFSKKYKKSEYLYYINTKYFLKSLKDSFRDNKNIIEQFKLDLHRSKYYINGYRIYDFEPFYYYLDSKINEKYINDILMIANQATLSFPLIYLYKNFEDLGYNIGGVEKNRKFSSNLIIKMNIDDKNIDFWIYKNLKIYKINENNIDIAYYVTIIMKFDILRDEYIECSIKFIK